MTSFDEQECLGFHSDSPCEGTIELHPTNPVRWRTNGTMVHFVRCAKHYAEYLAITEARIERELSELRNRRACEQCGSKYFCEC